MNVIFVADQIPEERQWPLILVAGGDEVYNRWDTLEETVTDHKQVEQVWNAFEKSFEQSTSKRESHILRGRVQHTRHASRPQEGSGDHRDDSAHGQATTSVISR